MMKRRITHPLLSAATLAALAALTTPAHAVIGVYDKYFVTTETTTGAPDANDGSSAYNRRDSAIDMLPGAFFNGRGTYSSAGSSLDTTGRLTAATSRASSTGLVNGIPTGDANFSVASANLGTGTLRAAVSSIGTGGFVQGTSFAQMHDILNFNIAGATATAHTRVTVQYTIDGSFASVAVLPPGNLPMALVIARLSMNNPSSAGGSLNAQATAQWDPRVSATSVPTLIGTNESFTGAGDVFNTGDVNGTGSWAGSSANLMTFTGSFDLIGSSVTLNPTLTLDVNCSLASCDFGNTARFSFVNLPSNVSYTSNSGLFLAAVPEPQSWALMFAGLVGIGFQARRRAG